MWQRGDGLAVKSMYCSCKEPEPGPSAMAGSSQLPVIATTLAATHTKLKNEKKINLLKKESIEISNRMQKHMLAVSELRRMRPGL